jgi:hypothetical protein
MRRHFRWTSFLATAATAVNAASLAQSGSAEEQDNFDRTPVNCVSMRRIEGTQIVDDQSILFYGRDGQIFLNILEATCPTLKQNKLFRYKLTSGTRTARLCDFNAITVVDGATNTLSYNCRLGMFHPIHESEAEDLLAAPAPAYDAGNVVLEPIDVTVERKSTGDAP